MIEIQSIRLDQVEEVKQMIFAVCQELFQVSEQVVRSYDLMCDINEVQAHYFNKNGTFLVLIDDSKVVGSGAIRHLNDEICELKRMWFLKDYRGRGLGMKMSHMLLDFAKLAGYKKIRLDCANEQTQAPAIKLYKQLSFYFIEKYNDGQCQVFMEKILS